MGNFIDDSLIFADALLHANAKRTVRLKGYYVCMYCDSQYIFNIPKKTIPCPCCNNKMHLVSVVDQYEVARIERWSNGTVLHREYNEIKKKGVYA